VLTTTPQTHPVTEDASVSINTMISLSPATKSSQAVNARRTEQPVRRIINMVESLLKCTFKKSASVAKKVGMVIGAIAAIVVIIYLIYLGGIAVYPTLIIIGAAITTFFLSIPWWIYVGIVLIAAIPTYSFVWCVARGLTDEDWQSDTAKNIALATLLALAALALADHKSMLFIGAYLHYRKRIRNELKIPKDD
jgi:hypothetical protein